ncbi:predicted protein [Pyrenophora tritici-repentis Pt-1C-BFP]|uniref:Uncharacterized protein n=1 Tax=Pyrenophora tritici-repentis (strain Pt-1C-BFP) TaxID=426418 RepID=B2W4D9_PYRTR|nr:uncharacterized protein PTRG_04489 [Pyrenophora tritici-repentis Pt-1C-BFP]EDU47396.1 predicted protein [Pyrenophora tritici-repentis Pt-1C-BFP]
MVSKVVARKLLTFLVRISVSALRTAILVCTGVPSQGYRGAKSGWCEENGGNMYCVVPYVGTQQAYVSDCNSGGELVGSPLRPEKAIAGIFAVFAAKVAAPMVPEKGVWTAMVEYTIDRVVYIAWDHCQQPYRARRA